MINLLLSLPLWLLAFVLNVWLIGFGLGGLWIARRWILPRLRLGYDDAYFGAAVVQSSMLLYGLVAALVAVGVWQKYSAGSNIVSGEATAIAILWRDFGGYPEPQRSVLRDLLRSYTVQVIHEAWPQQRRGEIPQKGVEWMDRIQDQLFVFEPTTESQKVICASTLENYHQLVNVRRQRLDLLQSGLPKVLWFVLLTGAMGCLVLCLFFHVNNARFQAILIVGIAAFLSMVLFVIIALDHPLTGEMAISANSYQLIYDHHMKK